MEWNRKKNIFKRLNHELDKLDVKQNRVSQPRTQMDSRTRSRMLTFTIKGTIKDIKDVHHIRNLDFIDRVNAKS